MDTTNDMATTSIIDSISSETSTNQSTSRPFINDPDHTEIIGYYLWVYGSPIIFILGIGGNILTVLVMRRKLFKGKSPSVYLPLLAIADACVLVIGLPSDWLWWAGFLNFQELSVWTCRFYKFVYFTAGDCAIWMIVVFTVDRFVAVCFPLHKLAVCVPRRAAIASVGVLFFAIAKNLHEFWTRGMEYDKTTGEISKVCGAMREFGDFHKYIRPWIAFISIMVIPFCIILICNCLIIRTLVASQRMRNANAVAGGSTRSSAGGGGGATPATHSYIQTTLMCLSVSFCFLVCIAPSIVILIGKPSWSKDVNHSYNISKIISNQLVYVNHSMNFFLYCLTGERFRSELAAMFGYKAPDNQKAVSKLGAKNCVLIQQQKPLQKSAPAGSTQQT